MKLLCGFQVISSQHCQRGTRKVFNSNGFERAPDTAQVRRFNARQRLSILIAPRK